MAAPSQPQTPQQQHEHATEQLSIYAVMKRLSHAFYAGERSQGESVMHPRYSS